MVIASLLLPIAVEADCPGAELTFKAGVSDDFAPPTEPTYQSPKYSHFLSTYWVGQGDRVFDETGIDLALGHTFEGWKGNVCGATLEFHIDGELEFMVEDDTLVDYAILRVCQCPVAP